MPLSSLVTSKVQAIVTEKLNHLVMKWFFLFNKVWYLKIKCIFVIRYTKKLTTLFICSE